MRRVIAVWIPIIIGLTLLTGCSGKQAETQSSETTSLPRVRVDSVRHGSLRSLQVLSGETAYLNRRTLTSPMSGYITESKLQVGKSVKKGQLLYRIRTREAEALGQSAVGTKDMGTVEVRARADGRILAADKMNGDFAAEGTRLGVMAQTSDFYIKLFVPYRLRDAARRQGQFTMAVAPGDTIRARLADSLATGDASSQTVIYLLRTDGGRVLPEGMNLNIPLVTAEHRHTQWLPKEAVLADETLQHFRVMKLSDDSLALSITVQRGLVDSGRVEILEPHFDPGSRIIIEGQYGLADSTRVKVQAGD